MYLGYRRQQGAGLIEVLVTMLLLSTSLLALASLQNKSLQFNQEAYSRSQANILAYDIIERVRVNFSRFQDYNISFTQNPSGTSAAAADLAAWRQDVTRLLPGGQSAIACTAATRICTVTLRWVETSVSSDEEEESEESGAEEGGEESGEDANETVPGLISFVYQTRV